MENDIRDIKKLLTLNVEMLLAISHQLVSIQRFNVEKLTNTSEAERLKSCQSNLDDLATALGNNATIIDELEKISGGII